MHKDVSVQSTWPWHHKNTRIVCHLTSAAVERRARTACCAKWGLSWLWCWRSAFPSAELMSASCTTDFAVHRVPIDAASSQDSARYRPGVPALPGGSPSEPSQCPDHKRSCHSFLQNGHLAKSLSKSTVIYLYENIILRRSKLATLQHYWFLLT